MVRNFLLLLIAAFALPGAMRIDQILNNYNPSSGPGLPNYAIAQGSITIVKGLELSDRSTGLQSTYPLPKILEGVTVEVTVGGTTTTCILYYVLPQQLAFIVPSNTPVGTGTLKITNNGKVGTAPITVARTGFGILTLNGAGTGPAGAFFAGTGTYVLNNNAANPDDFITLWGTGVGAFSGDETVLGSQAQDYTTIDTQVYVGSVPAQVIYRGASIYPGLNQVIFKVPAGSPGGTAPEREKDAASTYAYGCYVSVVVFTNGIPSNQTTLPIHAKGSRVCSDPVSQGLLSNAQLDGIAAKGSVTFASLLAGRTTSTFSGVPAFTTDSATGVYQRFDLVNFNLNSIAGTVSYGSCAITGSPKVATGVVLPKIQLNYLDAGPNLILAGNGNTATLPRTQLTDGLLYFSATGQLPTNFLGTSTSTPFSFTAEGGRDIGPHAPAITIPIGFTWTNEVAVGGTPIDRTKGVTITWANAPANTFVQITGNSTNAGGTVSFICFAPSEANTITIQPDVLLQLPASTGASAAAMSVATYVNKNFTADKLDYGIVTGFASASRGVIFF